MAQKRYLDTKGVLEIFPISRSGLIKKVKDGSFPAPIYFGSKPLWDADTIHDDFKFLSVVGPAPVKKQPDALDPMKRRGRPRKTLAVA